MVEHCLSKLVNDLKFILCLTLTLAFIILKLQFKQDKLITSTSWFMFLKKFKSNYVAKMIGLIISALVYKSFFERSANFQKCAAARTLTPHCYMTYP